MYYSGFSMLRLCSAQARKFQPDSLTSGYSGKVRFGRCTNLPATNQTVSNKAIHMTVVSNLKTTNR